MRWRVQTPEKSRGKPEGSVFSAPAPPSDTTPYPSSPLNTQVDCPLPAGPSWRESDTHTDFHARDQTILTDPLVEKEWEHLFPQVSDVAEVFQQVSDPVFWALLPEMTSPLPLLSDCPPPPLSELTAHGGPSFPPPQGHTCVPSFDERDWDDFLATLAPEVLEPVPVPKKRTREEDKEYVKKPPNAFLLFLRSERKTVQEELGIRNSATVNKALSERWKSLPAEKRGVFEAEAKVQADAHALKYPGWSNKINYGKKSKKSCKNAPPLPPPPPAADGAVE